MLFNYIIHNSGAKVQLFFDMTKYFGKKIFFLHFVLQI